MSDHGNESTRQAFVAMLRACADYLSTLPDGNVDAFLNGELELKFSVVAKKRKRKRQKIAALDAAQLSEIASRLRSLDNRADGERLLRADASSKSALELLARHLDVAVRREDRLDDLLKRIIEATIGFRLSSAVIQGQTAARHRDETNDSHSAKTESRGNTASVPNSGAKKSKSQS